VVATVEKELAKIKAPDLTDRTKTLRVATTLREKELAPLKGSLEALKKDPKDAKANLELGKYFALVRGNWIKALPYLTLGSDKDFQALAQKDLDQPKLAKERVSLGDGWWDLGEKEKDPARLHLRQRAVFWYEKALPETAGLNRNRLEKRVA